MDQVAQLLELRQAGQIVDVDSSALVGIFFHLNSSSSAGGREVLTAAEQEIYGAVGVPFG